MAIIHRLEITRLDDSKDDSTQEQYLEQEIGQCVTDAPKFIVWKERDLSRILREVVIIVIKEYRRLSSCDARERRVSQIQWVYQEQCQKLTGDHIKWKLKISLCVGDFSRERILDWQSKAVVEMWIDLRKWKLFFLLLLFSESVREEKPKEKVLDKEGGWGKRNAKKVSETDKFDLRALMEVKALSTVFALFICSGPRWVRKLCRVKI